MKDLKISYDTLSAQMLNVLQEHEHFDIYRNDCPLEVLENKLKYFISTLHNSLNENRLHTFYETIVWSYHTYFAQGLEYDFFLLEYSAWKLVLSEELSDSESKLFLDVIDKLEETHETYIQQSQSLQHKTLDIPTEWQTAQSKFKNALFRGDSDTCKDICDGMINDYASLHAFFLFIIHPSLTQVGEAWEEGLLSVAQEHLASSIVIQVLSIAYERLPKVETTKEKAIVGAVVNEFHEIGAISLANALELDGWSVHYMGSNVKSDDFIKAILEEKPLFVAISVAMPFNLQNARNLIKAIRKEDGNVKIMLGGSAFERIDKSDDLYGADIILDDVTQGIERADLWHRQNK